MLHYRTNYYNSFPHYLTYLNWFHHEENPYFIWISNLGPPCKTSALPIRMSDICSSNNCSVINANVKRNPNPKPNPKINHNPNPTPNQTPNHYPHSNYLLPEIWQEQLSPEQMSDHHQLYARESELTAWVLMIILGEALILSLVLELLL